MPNSSLRRTVIVLAVSLSLLGAADGPFDPESFAPPDSHPQQVRLAFMELPEADKMRFLRWLPRSGRRDLYDIAVESLYSPEVGTLEAAINCLSRIKVPLLMDNLHVVRERMYHHDPRIRWVVVRLLGEVKDDLAIEGLIERLNDEEKVATAARLALVNIAHYDAGSDPARWQAWFEEWLEIEQNVIPKLAARLQSEDEDVILRAMHMLTQLKSHRHMVGELLAPLADHPSPQVKALALSGLNNMGGVAALKSPAAEGRSLLEVLREADEAAGSEFEAPVADDTPQEQTGPGFGVSQVVTILVLLGLFGGAGFVVMRWVKQNPTQVRRMTQRVTRTVTRSIKRRKSSGEIAKKPEEPSKKGRITFTR